MNLRAIGVKLKEKYGDYFHNLKKKQSQKNITEIVLIVE